MLSVGLIVGFILRSLRAPEPLLDLRLFKRFNFSVATICIFLVGATLYGTMFLLPLYYQIVRGESPWKAGLLMAPQGIGAALVMRTSARAADRYGTRRTVPVGMALLALGTLAYTQVSGSTSYAFLAGALFVRGIGLGFGMMPVFAAAYRGLSFEQVPRASTATNIIRQVGGSIGVAVFAVVLQNAISHQFPGTAPSLGSVSSHPLPLAVANRMADAFATSFWWSFGVCAFAVLPAHLPARSAQIEPRACGRSSKRPRRPTSTRWPRSSPSRSSGGRPDQSAASQVSVKLFAPLPSALGRART